MALGHGSSPPPPPMPAIATPRTSDPFCSFFNVAGVVVVVMVVEADIAATRTVPARVAERERGADVWAGIYKVVCRV
jgi:protein-S-isoprenylcysteine O-methyltransferase Ste14